MDFPTVLGPFSLTFALFTIYCHLPIQRFLLNPSPQLALTPISNMKFPDPSFSDSHLRTVLRVWTPV